MKKINLWVVRPNPAGENRMKNFLEDNIIAIGGFNLSNVKEMDRKTIKENLKEINPEDTSSQKIALHAGIIFRFSQEMKEKDVVFVPDNDIVHLAQIVGPYYYSEDHQEVKFPHQRKVKWLKKNISRKSIPSQIQKNLSSKLTLYSINDNFDEIMEFIREVVPEEYSKDFNPSYEHLEEAVYIEIMLNYSAMLSPQPTIFELAKKNINHTTIERAKKIAEKVKVFCGNSKWKNGGWLHEEEFWINEIMDWVEEDRLEEVVEEEKERLFNEAENELKEALEIADQENDLDSLIEVIDSLDDMYKNIEDFRNKVISKLMPKLDDNKQEILEKAGQEQTINNLLSYMKNASEEEKEKFRKMLNNQKKEV